MNTGETSFVQPETLVTARRVLVVDDDRDFAEGLAAVLDLNGYSTLAVFSADGARKAHREFRPHVAILDICLGRTSGLDLLADLLRTDPSLLCVMATAHAELETAVKAVKRGAYDYLRKPLHAEEVLAVLVRCGDTLRLQEEKQEAEAAARRERALLFDAVESMAEGFMLFDSDDRLVLCNNRVMSTLDHIADVMTPGISFEEFIRASVARGAVPAAEGRVEEYVQERMARHRSPSGPFELKLAGGKVLRIDERRTAEGGWVCLYTDMTSRRHVEEALVESESRFKDMVANVPGVVYQMVQSGDGPAGFHYVSPSVTGLMGLDPESLMNDASLWFELIHPDDRDDFHDSLGHAAKEMAPWVWEGRIVLPGGGAWWCQGAARPRRMPNGDTLWNGIMLDVTERKELEEQLLQAQRLKVVGQLTGGIAHDFNNLMLSVQLNLEHVRDSVSIDPDGTGHIEQALKSLASARELTQRLLAFSRKQPLNPQPTDINDLVSDVAELVRRTLREDIQVEVECGADLWPALVDTSQLENALINLAINARDAMTAGGRLCMTTRNVEIGEAEARDLEEVEPGEYVMIAVADTGTGMTAEVTERAFEPFFTTKQVGEGSGLGLSMVYGFLKQSRGHVTLESEVGKGTVATLYLPRSRDTGKPRSQPEQPARSTMPRGSETVLVVEDEPSVRAIVVRLLENLGYRVIEAEDGVDALERFAEAGSVDLLFTDIVLPGKMDGIKIAAEIGARQPGLRVLFTSGYAGPAMDDVGRIEDGAELLSKPYPMKALAARVRDLLDTERD